VVTRCPNIERLNVKRCSNFLDKSLALVTEKLDKLFDLNIAEAGIAESSHSFVVNIDVLILM